MAGKVCNRAHLRFCGDKWYFQYQHYGFPGVTSDTENKYAFLFVAGKGPNKAVPEGYTCPTPSLLPAPLHTGDWGDTSNSPLAPDPRAWKSRVTSSSPHVPHQEHWCLGKGSVECMEKGGERWLWRGALTRWYLWEAVPSHAQRTELMGCHPAPPQRESASQLHGFLWSQHMGKNPPGRSVGQGFSFSDDSEKLLLKVDWGKVVAVDTLC